MTDVVWTRDALIANAESLLALDARGALTPHGIGHLAREIIAGFLDLVRDADPLPDADGWRPHTPGPCPVDPETVVEVKTAYGFGHPPDRADTFVWGRGSPADNTITHYRIVRPAPSGPVVEETVKRAYNDDQKRALGCLAHSIISGEPLESKYCRAILDMMAELEQRAKSARQIGEAMEGK